MGINDMDMSNFDADSVMYDRQNRNSSPDFQPGQGDDLDIDSIFSTDTNQNNGGMEGIFNTNPAQGSFNLNNQPQQSNNMGTMKSDEDKIFDVCKIGAKGTWNFFKDIGASFKGLTPLFVTKWGFKVSCVSCILIVLGIIFRIFGLTSGLQIAIGGCLSGAIGVFSWLFTSDSAKKYSSKYKTDNKPVADTSSLSTSSDININDDFFSSDNNEDFFDSNDNEDFFSDGDDEDFFDSTDNDEDFFDSYEIPQESSVSVEDALNEFQPMDRGMYTRQYLYDNFVKVLPSLESNFTKVTKYDEDSTEFNFWYDMVVQASEIIGLKEDELPDLISLEENLFTVTVKITRTPKLKPDLLADELAVAYAHELYPTDIEKRSSVFAKSEVVLKTCIITIFTGQSHIISLKDMYNECKDFILSTKNSIPIVLGVNELGKVIVTDFRNIESIIVAGMPRSGKTWAVQSIITQMCALLSPKEINFYILDPKAGTSDYKRFYLPHVKVFASKYKQADGSIANPEYKGIMETLRNLVSVEAPRRKKLLDAGDCVNINDYKKKFPDVDLPYIIVIIDEMVTLSSMEKEECKEYMTYLDQIVTQFPNLGIRGMFIPHEVKNQIISKTAYDSIKARISVKGSPEHIESSTGTKPKAFPYKLCNKGDMAVNIDTISASTLFVHGVVLTDSNEENVNLFDYLRRVWSKLEPDCVKGSYAEVAEQNSINDDLLQQLQDSPEISESDLNFFDDSQESDYYL